ncbi:MAG: DUF2764 family protein [Fibrobacterota bacterium]
MAVSYYYLVAALPDINETRGETREGSQGKDIPSFGDFIEDMREVVPEKDGELFSYVKLPFDNRNLINLLTESEEEFSPFGNYTKEEMQAEIKRPADIPEYMSEFLKAYRESRPVKQGLSWEDQLNSMFYEYAGECSNGFIASWFTFDMDFRNTLAAINCRRHKLPLEKSLVHENEVTEMLRKSNAADFGLSSYFQWAEKLFSLNFDDIPASEKAIDDIKIDMAGEMPVPDLFSIETLLAFSVRLSIAERWAALDPEEGRKKLERIIDDLENSYNVE